MTRRSTPERIDTARREATKARLLGLGMTEPTAEAWIAEWQAIAERDGLARGAAYWDAAWDWITAQRQTRSRP